MALDTPWLLGPLALGGLALGWVARWVLPVLLARYDRKALSVQAPGGPLAAPVAQPLNAAQQLTWERLRDGCLNGAGPCTRPIWRPGQAPYIQQRFGVLVLGHGDGDADEQRRWAELLSRELDGTQALARVGGRWAGLWLRLRVKWNDGLWWRARRSTDPWDSGYLLNEPAARAALGRFLPRRATLMVAARGWTAQALHSEIAQLSRRQSHFQHPVRLLVLDLEGKLQALRARAAGGPGEAEWADLTCEMSLIQAPERQSGQHSDLC